MPVPQIAVDKILMWRHNAIQFVRDEFNVEPDAWQAEYLKAYCDKNHSRMRIALLACAGPGKTACMCWTAWHFLACFGRPGDHPKGIAIAITRDNLRDNFWPEMQKWRGRSPYLTEKFEWTKERIFAIDHPEDWFFSARSWPQTADAETQGKTLSGVHSRYVMFVIDESAEIPSTVLRAAEQALSETGVAFGRIVQSGNPTSKNGMLYESTRIPDQWKIINISGDPDDPMRSPRIDIEWAKKQIEQYGRDNAWVQSYILGQFPTSSTNTLLSVEDVENAMGRMLTQEEYVGSQVRLGIDVARMGDDATVIMRRQGKRADFKPVTMRGSTGQEIASKVIYNKTEYKSEKEFVDNTGGYGHSCIDFLNVQGYHPIPVNFSQKANDQDHFFNRRAEMWWNMSEWIKKGGSLPNIPSIAKQFHGIEYMYKNDKILIEPKEIIKSKIGRSPDHADALALTFALPEQSPLGQDRRELRHLTSYDPFQDSKEPVYESIV